FALDQFHRVKALPCLLTNSELENGSDVLVSKSGRGASLAQETFSGFATFGANAELNDLQRDLTLKRRISGAISHAHRAATKLPNAPVLPAITLINSDPLVAFKAVTDSFFRDAIVTADADSQQTNHAAQSTAGRFLERAATTWTDRNFCGR